MNWIHFKSHGYIYVLHDVFKTMVISTSFVTSVKPWLYLRLILRCKTMVISTQVDDPELKPTDKQLYGLTELQVNTICLWRRALVACKDMNRVLAVNLSRRLGVETTVAQGLVNKLEREGYLKAPGKGKR